jgi:hypothetical protein
MALEMFVNGNERYAVDVIRLSLYVCVVQKVVMCLFARYNNSCLSLKGVILNGGISLRYLAAGVNLWVD